MTNWISAEERKPDEAGYYMVCEANNFILTVGSAFYSKKGDYFATKFNTTHWAEIVKPPEGE